ncbi:MAG: hypothetical protein H7A33_01770 [Deltaproteobacteria bacterium]|nr:hypothetical protein [Deltaproteobacteria bacterium]
MWLPIQSILNLFRRRTLFLKTTRSTVKEWEYTDISQKSKADKDWLKAKEAEYGDPTFWNALVSDRRVFFGPYCKYKQDYPSRFSHEQLLIILEQALRQILAMIEETKPHLILSFGTTTLAEYLVYLVAKKKGIPYRQFKSTKIKNYLSLNQNIAGTPEHVKKRYNDSTPFSEEHRQLAKEYIQNVQKQGVLYEGAIMANRKHLMARVFKSPFYLARGLVSQIKNTKDPVISKDPHITNALGAAFHFHVRQPLASLMVEKKLEKSQKYLNGSELDQIGDYVFFPLHFEPEVSLQVYGKPYQNQIELLRNISQNIPVHTKLVVKEHPRSLGFRPVSYYKKLLEIPNLYLVNPFLKGYQLVQHAQAVAVITGTIGFEAAIHGKPVMVFGNAPYQILPKSMVYEIDSLNSLAVDYQKLLEQHQYDEESLIRFICSNISEAVAVDLYSVLLNKGGRFSENQDGKSEKERYEEGYRNLAQALKKLCCEIQANADAA